MTKVQAYLIDEKMKQLEYNNVSLAKAVGTSEATIRKIRKGDLSGTAFDTVVAVCQQLDIPVSLLAQIDGMESLTTDEATLLLHYRSADSRAQWSAQQLLSATQVPPAAQDN